MHGGADRHISRDCCFTTLGLCRRVVNLNLLYWIVGLQFVGWLFGGTFVRKLGLEMPTHDYRLSTTWGDISPLNISAQIAGLTERTGDWGIIGYRLWRARSASRNGGR
jgi:hypothetical protein